MIGKCQNCRKGCPPWLYACDLCVATTQRKLSELSDLHALVQQMIIPGSSGGGPGPTGYKNTSPASEPHMVYCDPRSGAGAAVLRLRDPRDSDDDPIRSLPGSIKGIALWLADEVFEEPRSAGHPLYVDLGYVRGRVQHCAAYDWVGELMDDVDQLWRQGKSLAGLSTVDDYVGPCLDCSGPVYRRDYGVKCGGCGTSYNGFRLVQLSKKKG